MPRAKVRLYVFGAGALGRAIAELHAQSAWEISLVRRADKIFVQEPFIALFAVKAFDLEEAVHRAAPTAPPGAVFVSLSNGGVESEWRRVARAYPHLHFRLGTTTVAADLEGESVHVHSRGWIAWGSSSGDAITDLEDAAIATSEGHVRWEGDPVAVHRKKWLFNLCLNTLSGATHLRCNGDALKDRAMLADLFRECCVLYRDRYGTLPEDENALFHELVGSIELSAGNENSMARDVRLGRRTEVDYFSGRIPAGDEARYPLLAFMDAELRRCAPKAVRSTGLKSS